jgi:hypothetical protein
LLNKDAPKLGLDRQKRIVANLYRHLRLPELT